MRPLLRVATAVALALTLLPLAAAQLSNAQVGQFGTQVRVGDADYTPLMKESKAWTVAEADLGVPGVATDNCILLMYGHAASAGPVTKDLRLNACLGKPAGTLIGDGDVVEKQASYAARGALQSQVAGQGSGPTPQFGIFWVDMDGGGKYNRGDAVYLVSCTSCAGAFSTLQPTSGTGTWSLRLTPVAGFAAGTFVLAGDKDLVESRTQVRSNVRWIVGEREDKGWYLIDMSTTVPCCFTAYAADGNLKTPTASALILGGSPLPLNAIRLGVTATYTLQPSLTVTAAELANPDAAAVGRPLPVIVTMANNGATAGAGVIVTKLDKQIVDVRMGPVLAPGEVAKTIVTVAKVPQAGQQELEVNDVFLPVTVQGDDSDASSDEVAALRAQVDGLQGRLATLEAGKAATLQKPGSPGLAPLMALAALAGVTGLLRRRAA